MKRKALFILLISISIIIVFYAFYINIKNNKINSAISNAADLTVSDNIISVNNSFNLSKFSSIQINIQFPKNFDEWENRDDEFFYANPKIEMAGGVITSGWNLPYITYKKNEDIYNLVMLLSIQPEKSEFIVLECIQEIELNQSKIRNLQLIIEKP